MIQGSNLVEPTPVSQQPNPLLGTLKLDDGGNIAPLQNKVSILKGRTRLPPPQ